MARWGTRNRDGTWTCSYQGCSSRQTFNRGCDLRKHYKRHTKSLFCRYEGCPQSTSGGFSSKKDRLRHEQKHNPQVQCEYEDCDRRFSRVDNMVSLDTFTRQQHTDSVAERSCSTSSSKALFSWLMRRAQGVNIRMIAYTVHSPPGYQNRLVA